MIRKLMVGAILSLVIALLAGFLWDWKQAMNVSGGAGIILLLLAGIFNGALISGDRMRANQGAETAENREFRSKLSSTFFIFGFPFLLTAAAIFFITK